MTPASKRVEYDPPHSKREAFPPPKHVTQVFLKKLRCSACFRLAQLLTHISLLSVTKLYNMGKQVDNELRGRLALVTGASGG